MAGGTLHPEPLRLLSFDQCQNQSAEHKQQKEVHEKPEKCRYGEDLEKQDQAIVYEEFQEDRVIGRIDIGAMIDPRLEISHNDQQEPSQGKTHMHVSKQRIAFP